MGKPAKTPLALDGFLQRRTRYGAWKERYFRTEGYALQYYSENINLIKANRIKAGSGPYRHRPVGSASETVDLRGETRVSAHDTDPLVFAVAHGFKTLEVRAPDLKTRDEWVDLIENIVADHSAKKKAVGSLEVEVDGAYLIGGAGLRSNAAKLEFQFRDEVFSSDAQAVETWPALEYENLDEAKDDVGYCALRLAASVPVFQTSTQFELRILGEDAENVSPAKAKKEKRGLFGKRKSVVPTTLTKAPSPLKPRHNEKPNQSYATGIYDAIVGAAPEVLAARHTTLFELQSENALRTAGVSTAGGGPLSASSALEDDVALDPFWPALAPDGRAPRPGWRWYPLFDRVAEPESSAKDAEPPQPLRVRALLHCRVRYAEGLLAVAMDTHPRYEAAEDTDEFRTELLTNGMQRLAAVADAFGAYGGMLGDLLSWKSPVASVLGWALLVGGILAPPDHAALTVFPVVMLLAFLSGLPRALRGADLREAIGSGLAANGPQRAAAEVRVDVLEARDVVAGDVGFTEAPSSDPYAVVVHVPPSTRRGRDRELSEMLVGVSATRPKTLNPEWTQPVAVPKTPAALAEPSLERFQSQTSHLDEIFSLLAPGLRADGAASDVMNDVYDAASSRNAANCSSAALKTFGGPTRPAIDFRSKWRPGEAPGEASWTYPLMQETDASSGVVEVLVPWRQAQGSIGVELYDRDLVENDDFLGRARIPLRELARAPGMRLEGWFKLEPSGDATRDAAMTQHKARSAVIKAAPYGEVKVRVSLRLLERAATPKWRYEQALCQSLLEPTFEITRDKRAGYVGQYKSATRTLKGLQDQVLMAAGMAERVHALLTWTHPTKTLTACAGLVAGVVACSLVPNKLLVAALLSKLFVKGLAVRLKGVDTSKVKKRPDDEIQLDNFLASLPTAPQQEVAQRHKRQVWVAQHARELNRVRVALNFAFRVRCLGPCAVLGRDPESIAGVAGLTEETTWVDAFCAVVNGLVVAWPSLDAAAANKKPTHLLTIAGPVHPAEGTGPAPPRGRTVVTVATKSGDKGKIRDFLVALKSELVDEFSKAVRAELLEAHAA